MQRTTDLVFGQELVQRAEEMRNAFWPPVSAAVILPDIYAGPDLVFQGTFWGLKTSGSQVSPAEAAKNLATIDPAQLYQARKDGASPKKPDARRLAKRAVDGWTTGVGIVRINLRLSAHDQSSTDLAEAVRTTSGRTDLLLHVDRRSLERLVRPDFARVLVRLYPDSY